MGRKGILGGWKGGTGLWIAIGCGLVGLLLPGSAGAAEAPLFDAHGSVEQVYATGLAPGAQVSLFDGEGHEVATKSADELGGVLFRGSHRAAGIVLPPAGKNRHRCGS
jgi:hypothetical protein